MMEKRDPESEKMRPFHPPFFEKPDLDLKDPKPQGPEEPRVLSFDNMFDSFDALLPPKPLLNLSVTESLMDLKQDQPANKGEDANLHLIHEFETEEIQRAKEYEHRAQMWDAEHGYEGEFELNDAPLEPLAEPDNVDDVDVEDLLFEVNKVLHTRFKNLYEGEMLLPNLDYNPDYEAPF